MQKGRLIDISMDFAVSVLNITGNIKGHYSLVNQLERAASSIGANIHEANYAQSKADFIAKMHIALKECYETQYWLELFSRASICDSESLESLMNQCGKIRRMLVSSLTTVKDGNK